MMNIGSGCSRMKWVRMNINMAQTCHVNFVPRRNQNINSLWLELGTSKRSGLKCAPDYLEIQAYYISYVTRKSPPHRGGNSLSRELFFPFFTLKFCAETSPSSQLIKKRDIKKEVSFKWILIEERYFSNNRQNMFSPCISRSDQYFINYPLKSTMSKLQPSLKVYGSSCQPTPGGLEFKTCLVKTRWGWNLLR